VPNVACLGRAQTLSTQPPNQEEEEELKRQRQPPLLDIPSPTANSVGSVSPRKQKKLPPIVLETKDNHVRPKATSPKQKKLPPIVLETKGNYMGPQTLNPKPLTLNCST